MRSLRWAPCLVLGGLLACGENGESSPEGTSLSASRSGAPKVELQIVFVHGVTQADAGRRVAHEQLVDLERGVVERIAARGDERVAVSTARVNIYTDASGELVSPRFDDLKDGTGLPTANAWRAQLIAKTNAVFPTGRNIVFVGHSTGGRVVAEVGASPEMRDRVAGVVTVHGMIDALQSPKYDVIGPTSYVTGCKLFKSDGWCEYSGLVSGVPALDWLARERHVLSLVSASSCIPGFWEGANDQALPLQAQSSPWSPGLTLTPALGKTYAPAHGTFYGEFCHPDVVDRGSAKHVAAVTAASSAIVEWLFDAAPRVVASAEASPDDPYEIAPLAAGVLSAPLAVAGACPEGRHAMGKVDVAGLCRHPGFANGNDHPFDASNPIALDLGAQCDATLRVAHGHAGKRHAMRVWTKSYSLPEGGGLVSTLR
ncbi:MAG: hypothetical protein KIT84_32210 [Labilithrix sp.]|nr:hypothetical protein [Labilithrix sp.]MCW5815737.1 hypothetical protein [Labilithrix sp.]